MDDRMVWPGVVGYEDDLVEYSNFDKRHFPRDGAANGDKAALLRFMRPG